MNDANFHSDDRISALADDALTGSARAQAAQCVLSSEPGMRTWHAYHVIGDVLRSPELAPRGDDHAFWDRLSEKIGMEPGRPVVNLVQEVREVTYPSVEDTSSVRASSNSAVWRWKLLAGVACAALGGVLGVGLWDSAVAPSNMAASVANSTVVTVVDGRNGPMLRDPQLDSLMAAHQQVSGHSALQAPAGFLRNATYEGSAR